MSTFTGGTAPETPSVTLFGAMPGYDPGAWRYTLNNRNPTDQVRAGTCFGRGECWRGARRAASARYRF